MKDIEEPFPTGSKVWQHEFLVRESSCEDVFRVRRHATNKKNPGKVRNSPGGAGTRRLGVKHKKWGRTNRNATNDELLTGLIDTKDDEVGAGGGGNGRGISRMQQIRDEEIMNFDEEYDEQDGGVHEMRGDIPVSDIIGAIRNTAGGQGDDTA